MSHPVWVCGLKLMLQTRLLLVLVVTPCMGVWIETAEARKAEEEAAVTPCMGVWIETWVTGLPADMIDVTPCMGVWIETFWA